jgi:hypothetical protein
MFYFLSDDNGSILTDVNLLKKLGFGGETPYPRRRSLVIKDFLLFSGLIDPTLDGELPSIIPLS